jgi:hypothetical protein
VPWELQLTKEAETWMRTLGERNRAQLIAAFEALERDGPTLGRPLVDRVKSSRHHHMKELRPRLGNLRVLFAFDPNRRAVVLAGGDKTRDGNGWYPRHIRLADRLYDQHLQSIGKGKEAKWRLTRTGERSSGR